MKYEVIDYNKEILIESYGMCEEGIYCEICNHDEGNQHPKHQENLTRKSLMKS